MTIGTTDSRATKTTKATIPKKAENKLNGSHGARATPRTASTSTKAHVRIASKKEIIHIVSEERKWQLSATYAARRSSSTVTDRRRNFRSSHCRIVACG